MISAAITYWAFSCGFISLQPQLINWTAIAYWAFSCGFICLQPKLSNSPAVTYWGLQPWLYQSAATTYQPSTVTYRVWIQCKLDGRRRLPMVSWCCRRNAESPSLSCFPASTRSAALTTPASRWHWQTASCWRSLETHPVRWCLHTQTDRQT